MLPLRLVDGVVGLTTGRIGLQRSESRPGVRGAQWALCYTHTLALCAGRLTCIAQNNYCNGVVEQIVLLGGSVDLSVSSSILQLHCVHLCVLSASPVWELFDLPIMKTLLPHLFLLLLPTPPAPPFLPPFPSAAFHVTTVSRWTTPLTPNAKSGTCSLKKNISETLLLLRICAEEVGSWVIFSISFRVWSFLSPRGGSLDLSRSCQTVWTRQDRKVMLVQLSWSKPQFRILKYVPCCIVGLVYNRGWLYKSCN